MHICCEYLNLLDGSIIFLRMPAEKITLGRLPRPRLAVSCIEAIATSNLNDKSCWVYAIPTKSSSGFPRSLFCIDRPDLVLAQMAAREDTDKVFSGKA